MKRKLLSIVLAAVMILGILPGSAFATTTLYYINISGLDAPVKDATPDYNVSYNSSITLDSGNNSYSYYKNGMCWYDMTEGRVIAVNSKFVAGHQYKAVFYIKSNADVFFADSISVTVDNSPATVTDFNSTTDIIAEYVFPPIPMSTAVTSINYRTDRMPIAGDPLETVTLLNIDGSDELSVVLEEWDGAWYENDTDTGNPDDYVKCTGNIYKAGVAYAYRVEFTVKDGFILTENTQVTLNTTTQLLSHYLYRLAPDGKTAVYYFFPGQFKASKLDSARYNIDGYGIGMPISALSLSSTSDVNCGSYGTDYFITIGNRIPVMSGNFQEGAQYTLYIAVTSDTHDVSSLTKSDIKLGSLAATATEVVDGKLFAIFYLDKLYPQATGVYNILLATEVKEPVAGDSFFHPTIYSINADEQLANVAVVKMDGEEFGWYKAEYAVENASYQYLGNTGKFEDKKAYSLLVGLKTNDGYEFTDDCWVSMSSPDGLWMGEIIYREERNIYVEFNFNLGAPTVMPVANNAKVTLRGYEQGKSVTDIRVSISINGKNQPNYSEVYGMQCVILDENGTFMEGGTFAYDKDYKLGVILSGENYDITGLKAKDVTLNNVPASLLVNHGNVSEVIFELPRLKKPIANPFKDVKSNMYYHDSVLWAYQNGITAGVSTNQFAPDQTCTRAQVVSFLWRAAGCPEPQSANNPFTDVKQGSYYYKAVLWAVENGITAGVSPTRFAPDEACTRTQVVSFLWRAEGFPQPKSSKNPFTDVKSGTYYYEPVLWAVENGITAGVSPTKFAPDEACTRAQIVCFLDRNFS